MCACYTPDTNRIAPSFFETAYCAETFYLSCKNEIDVGERLASRHSRFALRECVSVSHWLGGREDNRIALDYYSGADRSLA